MGNGGGLGFYCEGETMGGQPACFEQALSMPGQPSGHAAENYAVTLF